VLFAPEVHGGVSAQNWTLLTSDYGYFYIKYNNQVIGTVFYYYEVYGFKGYVQDGYIEWYAVYLRVMNDPVNPTSNSEGFTVAGKAGQSPSSGGVGPYVYDKFNVFGIANLSPSQSSTSCATSWSDTFSFSASVSKGGPSVSATYSQSTTWKANGVAWSLTDVYPKSHWEFWQCNEPPPNSAELGSAWTFEISVIYVKKYANYPGPLGYTIWLGPAGGFRHWYQKCSLWWCWWEWDYSVHQAIEFPITFYNFY